MIPIDLSPGISMRGHIIVGKHEHARLKGLNLDLSIRPVNATSDFAFSSNLGCRSLNCSFYGNRVRWHEATGGLRMIVKRTGRSVAMMGALLIASHFACAAACDISDMARYAAYSSFLHLATDEATAVMKKNDNYSFNAAVEELTKKNVPLLKVGDARAVRLLIGLGLFTAQAANKEPLDVTFKLTCEAARRGLPPRNVADPLACAVIALYGSRRDDAANRTLAKEMLELAKTNLTIDPEPADARYRLEIVAPVIEGCAS